MPPGTTPVCQLPAVCRDDAFIAEKCDEALASPLPHSAFSGSSTFSSGYAPGYAKLNQRGGAGGWSPAENDNYQWLQVDLGNRKQVTAIATQGRYSSSDWTKQYRLLYSETGMNWKPYHQDGNIWTFSGNSNTESVVRHDLQLAVVARYLRMVTPAVERGGPHRTADRGLRLPLL
ncbi:hypothetical protein COCON_G00136760 [Conger conger]|uniref:F5/8 type C domain-containing protein n=1 Tax=Conger conger TaxID=82655 RepID=A0A9Q1DF37_CONCO|nr:hypothetical protein COCON_G00136760 [Conger conger]